MKKADLHSSPDQVKLTGRLSEFREALQEEINEIENNGQNSTILIGGHSVEAKRGGFWYRFFVEYMPLLPADTPCKLIIGTEQFDVTVISSNENEIIVSSKKKLPANIGKARLENGSTVLMERLIKCIEDNAEKDNPAGARMFPDPDGYVYQVKNLCSYDEIHYEEHSNEGQKKAVKSAIENDITYIWGPPGTGKTTVIGNIIDELYEHERSVLIVSHTNTAVDGAIIKADKTYRKLHQNTNEVYPILRLGIASEGVPRDAQLDAHIERLGEELFKQKEALEKRRQVILDEIEKIGILLAKENWQKKSNLPEIQRLNEVIVQLQEKRSTQEEQSSRLQPELDNVVKSHPEGQSLLKLEENYQEKKAVMQETREAIALLRAQKNQTERQWQNAKDELKKHTFYDELTQKIERLGSEQFYADRIAESKTGITSFELSLKTLKEKKTALQASVNKYESKGSIAKFFASKAAYEQDRRALSDTNRNIETASDMLRQKERVLADYQKQLSDLRFLLEKRKTVTPTKTTSYWTEEEQRLRENLLEMENSLSTLEGQENTLISEVAFIEFTKTCNQDFFNSIELLQGEINTCKQLAEESKKQIVLNQNTLTKLLDDECELCISFFESSSDDANETIRALSSLNDAVYAELHSVDIEEEKKQKEAFEEESNQILAELKEIQNKMDKLEKQAIMNARIVGTTLAKSYLSDVLRERQFDTVILDEASMASIPALWCAAYLAEKNIVIVGDFLQLPPIVMSNTPMAQKWLGRDIFDHSGMQEMAKKENQNIRPSNFVMLNEQYRMESDIAKIANLYYGQYTELKSDDMNPQRIKDRDFFYSWYSGKKTQDHIHLIDTESLHAWVTGIRQAKGHSRLNFLSAAVDVALAFKCLDKLIETNLYKEKEYKGTKVLIVAPYKPHVAWINKLIENEYQCRGIDSECSLVRAGTIHSFQGSEADIVIFDLVIDEPHWKANLFISDPERNAALEKMFNVAVTRAKFKLYVVADFKYCQSRAKNNPLSDLLKHFFEEKKYIKVDAKKLLPKLNTSIQNRVSIADSSEADSIILTESEFHDYFMSDIQSFRQSMIIYSPFLAENRISILLPVFYEAISQGKRIIVITKPLSERGKTELSHYKQCEDGLRNIGVAILHKKGTHEKIILIDDDIIWTGSLNALSYTGNTGEVMERRKDKSKEKTLINSYIKALDVEYLIKALENDYETKCPICGQEMLIAESDDGGIYWKCITGDYSRNKDQQYPVDGILRCAKCGGMFSFSMKKQPRWVCKADPKHYQLLRKNDLKLPQMADLLTQAERKQVQKYFEELAKKQEQ